MLQRQKLRAMPCPTDRIMRDWSRSYSAKAKPCGSCSCAVRPICPRSTSASPKPENAVRLQWPKSEVGRTRAGEAERRISEMNKRSAEIAAEQEAMAGRPEILASEISALQADKDHLGEKLAQLQVAETASEAALKSLEAELATAAEALSSAREARAGAEARAENQDQRRVEMGRISGERFECPPPVLPEKLEFDESAVDDAATESARLDRLQGERERIGPVNLIAADELAELEEEQSARASPKARN